MKDEIPLDLERVTSDEVGVYVTARVRSGPTDADLKDGYRARCLVLEADVRRLQGINARQADVIANAEELVDSLRERLDRALQRIQDMSGASSGPIVLPRAPHEHRASCRGAMGVLLCDES